MSEEFLKIWSYDEVTGDYVLPNFKSFFINQKKAFPKMSDLYKHQMDLVKAEHPNVALN